jgi:hypothetical protein
LPNNNKLIIVETERCQGDSLQAFSRGRCGDYIPIPSMVELMASSKDVQAELQAFIREPASTAFPANQPAGATDISCALPPSRFHSAFPDHGTLGENSGWDRDKVSKRDLLADRALPSRRSHGATAGRLPSVAAAARSGIRDCETN